MKLEDGKLYETSDGRRFRVTHNKPRNWFDCLQSYNGSWAENGHSLNSTLDDLVRVVEENRWISVSEEDSHKEDQIYRWKRGHLQMQVTRGEAKRRAPNYEPPKQSAPVLPACVSGHILAPKDNAWFNWAFSTENGTIYLDIETSKGAKLKFPL